MNREMTARSTGRWLRRVFATTLVLAVAASGAAALAASASTSDPRWHALQGAHWIQDGRSNAPRIVYMFTDPNCPYCNKLWTDSRPWVDAGRVQIRHVMVAILTPTSATKAAALLDAKDNARALADYERRAHASTAAMLASGHVRPLGDDGSPPPAAIPEATQAALDANLQLMRSLKLEATPAVAWLGTEGLQVQQGVSLDDESRIFGPR